jgi:hypothetical protein
MEARVTAQTHVNPFNTEKRLIPGSADVHNTWSVTRVRPQVSYNLVRALPQTAPSQHRAPVNFGQSRLQMFTLQTRAQTHNLQQ